MLNMVVAAADLVGLLALASGSVVAAFTVVAEVGVLGESVVEAQLLMALQEAQLVTRSGSLALVV